MCYSFSNELLKDHIEKALWFMEHYFIGRKYDIALARVLEINENIAQDLLRYVVIMHDCGKGLKRFQIERSKFPAHEFYSAFLAKKGIMMDGIAEIVAASIALHHHTMIGRGEHIRREEDELDPICRKVVESFLERLSAKDVFQLKIPERVKGIEVIQYEKTLSRTLQNNIKSIYMILYPLVICDNWAAGSRGKGESILADEISKVYG